MTQILAYAAPFAGVAVGYMLGWQGKRAHDKSKGITK